MASATAWLRCLAMFLNNPPNMRHVMPRNSACIAEIKSSLSLCILKSALVVTCTQTQYSLK